MAERMRILFVNKLYSPDIGGGAEITLASLAQGMADRGHDVRVLTTHWGRTVASDTVKGVTVVRLPLRNIYWSMDNRPHGRLAKAIWHAIDSNNIWMASSIREQVNEYLPTLISAHNLGGLSSIVWPLAKELDVPVVQVLHDYYNLCCRSTLFRNGRVCSGRCVDCRVLRRNHRQQSRAVSVVVGVSEAVLRRHLDSGYFSDAVSKQVVYNAKEISISSYQSSTTGPLRVGFIGTLSLWKGIELLLTEFTSCQVDGKPMHLFVAGSGLHDYTESLKRRFGRGLVTFVGYVQSEEFYQRIDVLVVPSLWDDPLPGVVFEALSAGVPVIGARRGGIPEMVQDGINGLLFDPSEVGALRNCLIRLRDEVGLQAKLRSNATRTSARFRDVNRFLSEHQNAYEIARSNMLRKPATYAR